MRTIAIVNQKGGCGKTTSAINLAAVYARRGLRTLLIDLDPQAHCAAGLGVPEARIERTIADAMLADELETMDRSTYIWEVARKLDLVPSTMRLAALEAPGGGLHQKADRDLRLARVIEHLAASYDRCLIDCPPTIGLLTFNALRAAREVLVPVETGYFALKGAQKQWETIQRVIKRIGRPIACHLLPTLHDTESELAKDILVALRRQFAGQILPIVIRAHPELRVAASRGQAVIECAPESDACRDYEQLADWLESHDVRPVTEVEVLEPARDVPPPIGSAAGRAEFAAVGAAARSPGRQGAEGGGDGGRARELVARLRSVPAVSERAAPVGADAGGAANATNAPVGANAATTAVASGGAALARSPRAALPVSTAPAVSGSAPPPTAPANRAESGAGAASGTGSAAATAPHGLVSTDRARFGIRTTPNGVLFVQPGEADSTIAVAGDFNGWRPASTPLLYDPRERAFRAFVRISPGRHQYRLVIDGRWQSDPYNDDTHVNEHGEKNSVLVVAREEHLV